MKNLFVRTGAALLCSVAVSAFAYDLTLNDTGLELTVNGQACLDENSNPGLVSVSVNGTAVDIMTSAGDFTCGNIAVTPPSSSSSSSASSVSSVSSSSSSSGGPSACGNWPGDVVVGPSIDLTLTSQTTQALTGNKVVSFPAYSENSGKASMVNIAGTASGLGVNRDIWISECPGGEALASSRCGSSGSEALTIRVAQGAGSSSFCKLDLNKQYYVNVRNKTCASESRNCAFYYSVK